MRLLISSILQLVAFIAALGIVLFIAAGRVDLPAFWAYLLLLALLSIGCILLLFQRSPDLLQERVRPGPGEQDPVSLKAMVLFYFVQVVLAGLDIGRFHWTPTVPLPVQAAAFTAYTGSFGLVVWAMLANPFFSSAVRIQEDRGQQVVSSGPYQYVRHPGYTGGIVWLLSSGLALGSWLAVLTSAVTLPFLFRRTLLEEAMLERDLPGYREYMSKVRWRIIPGVW